MSRNQDLEPGAVVMFLITAAVGGYSAWALIGFDSPIRRGTGSSMYGDAFAVIVAAGLLSVAAIGTILWWYYAN